MNARPREVRLGHADLSKWRHVCGIFEGAEDAARAVMPFVTDAIERGERVVHIVEDPDAYIGALPERARAAADAGSGQLDIRTWDATYLAGGRFGARRMRSIIKGALREGRALGFPGVRLIGDMEWAADGVLGIEELIDYEADLDTLVARRDVSILCAYDVRRHSASRISQVLGAHRAAVIGGELKLVEGPGRAPSPRERILTAASALFSDDGVTRTGVDTLIEVAGVAKATFYRHFPSKEALVIAWLLDPRTRWFEGVRAEVEARATTPGEQVSVVFETVAEWLELGDFVGCPYLNTAVETDAAPVSAAIRDYLAAIEGYLQGVAAAAGHPEPERAGRELQTLLSGSISLGVAHRTTAHMLVARDAAARLLAVDSRPSRSS